MYEVDFTGWTRTPEAIKELKESKLKLLKFHLRRVKYSILYRRGWSSFWYNLKCAFTLNKNL